ncbi:MAG TPA: nucleotidyltransferase family protein [Pyrinomonadaceae bacterium]|nr:nucleotidyltransferase family protein [Pyrinomonadaceae bacterium]
MPGLNHELEHRLLSACASVLDKTGARLPHVGEEEIDWDYFYCLARRHSLVPLVSRRLESSIEGQVPAGVRQRFRKDYQENAARNLIFVDELTALLERFAAAGIEAIVFKGPALAVLAYGDLNLRRFVDLDLIVRRAEMARAIEVLARSGYVSSRDLTGEQQAVLLRTQHNLQFTRGRVIVELHWQVSSELFASTVTAEELWNNLTTVELNHRPVKTLAAEDLLFALCVHGSRHVWQRLAWICDIDRLIRTNPAMNWTGLNERAKRAHAERMFLLGPALAAKLLATDLPAPLANEIARDKRIAELCDEIGARLFDGPEQTALPLWTVIRFNLLIRSGWRSRIRYGRFLFDPTDSDLDAIRLTPKFHFVYYLLRPFRLLHSALRQH